MSEVIPAEILADIEKFEENAGKFQRGEMDAQEFRKFRLRNGIYGQRQEGVQMIRVKIPGGRLSSAQLRRLGDVAATTQRGVGHITTRQNIQYHFVPLAEVPAMLRSLGGAGLFTKEACGNTIRNVVACPLAGASASEPFDVTPYTEAIWRFFIRDPRFQDMPRKFKITLEGCAEDHVQPWINDVGLTAKLMEVDGKNVKGFHVVVGGGLGNSPELAHVLSEFVPADEILPLIEAVLHVFTREGNYKDKNRARMKWVLRKMGMEAFTKAVWEERAKLPPKVPIAAEAEEIAPVQPTAIPMDPSKAYQTWAQSNVHPQKQSGYALAWVRIPLGDLTSKQFHELARLADEYADGEVRISTTQNLLFRFVNAGRLPGLFHELERLNLALPRVEQLSDVVACPGADTCQLGITSSRGLAALSVQALDKMPNTGGCTVKVSGCPNSCGQHHTAGIGFYGMARKLGGKSAPVYQVLLAGGIGKDGPRFGRMIAKIPARHAPAVVEAVLAMYEAEKQPGELFVDWGRRVDPAAVEARIKDLTLDRANPADEANYVDLGDSGRFSNGASGQGECAA